MSESYFDGIRDAVKTLATGLKITMKEYFTPKSTEQYPENRKTTLHVAKRHRGRLVFKRVTEDDLQDAKIQARGPELGGKPVPPSLLPPPPLLHSVSYLTLRRV